MSRWNKQAPLPESQLRDTLELAHKELTGVARTKGLSPNGERERDMCCGSFERLGQPRRQGRRR